MRILHVLHHSIPYLDGYSIRSRAIVHGQAAIGLSPVVVTSAHHEVEVKRRSPGPLPPETFDGITYYRTPLGDDAATRLALRAPYLREQLLMRALSRSIEEVLSRHPVDLIHSHSPALCGLPALRAARRHGLPFVYEVRAFWEDAYASSSSSSIQRLKYHYGRALENRIFRQADAVIAISHHMIAEIASRGIPAALLHRMPNGVDADQFAPVPRDAALAARLGVGDGPVVGFIGSFFRFEGLDSLLRAFPAVLQAMPTARLVLVGGGEAEEEVRALTTALGLTDRVVLTGRVAHHEIPAYYSIMDVLVYPRHRDRVTELVTPLKPLEAMALGKPVIGSDVGGISELLDDGRAGVLFRADDAADLAKAIVRVLTSPAETAALAARARDYVLTERRWDALVPGYLEIYRAAVRSHKP